MNANAIQRYVQQQKRGASVQYTLFGVAALLAGLLAVFLTFWFSYAIIFWGWGGMMAAMHLLGMDGPYMPHRVRLMFSGTFIVLLFVQHFRTSPWHWGEYPEKDYKGFVSSAGGFGGLASMLAYPGASANMVADILLTGPRLVTGSWKLFVKAKQLRQLDEASCAAILEYLAVQPHAVSYEDLAKGGWSGWLEQLKSIEGVLFLQKGLVMSPELRQELASL